MSINLEPEPGYPAPAGDSSSGSDGSSLPSGAAACCEGAGVAASCPTSPAQSSLPSPARSSSISSSCSVGVGYTRGSSCRCCCCLSKLLTSISNSAVPGLTRSGAGCWFTVKPQPAAASGRSSDPDLIMMGPGFTAIRCCRCVPVCRAWRRCFVCPHGSFKRMCSAPPIFAISMCAGRLGF